MTDRVLALVGCGSKKRKQPTAAKALYISSYFIKKRQWAEGCHAWRILSAEHGLVHPDEVLEPYDTALVDLDDTETRRWAEDVMTDLRPLLDDFNAVVVLAGRDYFTPIRGGLDQAAPAVQWPFEGKQLFDQMDWLENSLPPNQSTIDSFE
ncbi:DUF6884 domain-containing protein [Natronorubrum sp. A-ect3]|uniref:DUF6884 domain-containing protein n=1 Tax=Natronorubrum sp. A-ect3 TaxID=3242698 RepID=UPI00359D8D8C